MPVQSVFGFGHGNVLARLWVQVVEGGSERHVVKHEIDLGGEFEPNDLKQIADAGRVNCEDLGWINVGHKVSAWASKRS